MLKDLLRRTLFALDQIQIRMTHRLDEITLFEWRDAFSSEYGPYSTIRLLLWTLSKFMNPKGRQCFPSINTLATASGLSARSVGLQLKRAENEGWIIRKQKRNTGQQWALYHYECNVPEKVRKQLRYLQPKGEEAASVPSGKGEELDAQGSKLDGKKVPKQVPTNSLGNFPTDVEKIFTKGLDDDLKQICGRLKSLAASNGNKFNPTEFAENQIRNGAHPKAVVKALEKLHSGWNGIKYPIRYASAIIEKIDRNYHQMDAEADSIRESNAHKENIKHLDEQGRVGELFRRFEPDPEQWAVTKKKIRAIGVQ